ncbi:hypothetical protein COLO4_00671 [Corchorus olitorius]|uniref:TonB-dependent receptor-like beta-barrel domain-containing protein n=1 Tax=Corchorus olitorius TaxID=93759 RepID=A0A1R3L3I2_9ROSI|nr:hypothetical protein COLO4_00671 [Corchorus olitorius]
MLLLQRSMETGLQMGSFVNQNASPSYVARLGSANTNWQDQIYQKAWGTDNNVSFSGGVKGLPYRVSLGYNEQNGTFTDNRFPATGVIANATYFDPTQPVYSGNSNYGGYYEWLDPASNTGLNVNATANPVAQLNAVRDVSSVWRALGNIQLDYKLHFLPDLHFNVNAGYDYSKGEGAVTIDPAYKSGIGVLGFSYYCTTCSYKSRKWTNSRASEC